MVQRDFQTGLIVLGNVLMAAGSPSAACESFRRAQAFMASTEHRQLTLFDAETNERGVNEGLKVACPVPKMVQR